MNLCPISCATVVALVSAFPVSAQVSASPQSSPKHVAASDWRLDSGAVTNGVYHNKTLAFSLKIPPGWVLRTDDLNAQKEEKATETNDEKAKNQAEDQTPTQPPASSAGAKVLLAAFSRPPEARAKDVNSSILVAAENQSNYPGLKEAAQYFYPLTEVAKAQGFLPDEDPYGIAVGSKVLVRGDFHKDVGTRVMHQATLAMLSHGYAISITLIAGTEDEVEDLIDGLTFSSSSK